MPGPSFLRLAIAALGLVLACNAELEPIPARPPGLVLLGQTDLGSAHLTEATIVGELVYVANSNDLFAVHELRADGGLDLVTGDPGGLGVGRRCTVLAAHQPSASLYCGNDYSDALLRYDLGDPRAPSFAGEWFGELFGASVSDMVVVGDQLVLARFDKGLASVAIGPEGDLMAMVEQPEFGNLRRLELDAQGRVWALTLDRGLLVLGPAPAQPGTWVELARLDLDGPPLGLGVDGSRAAVGLGSAGLALVELDADGLHQTHALHPAGVVTAADLAGDVAVAATLLGPFVYDLRALAAWPEDPRAERAPERFDEGGARLLGFRLGGTFEHGEGVGAMLDARLLERDGRVELITTDWVWVERWAIDPDGFPAGVDVRRGEFIPAEAETVEIRLHNPTPFALRARAQAIGQIAPVELELEPRTTSSLSLSTATLEIDTPQRIHVAVYDGDEIVANTAVTILRRPPVEDWPVTSAGRPPPGEPFPNLALANGEIGSLEPLSLPIAGVRQRIVFYGVDCAAMWPEVEDLLWRVRAGRLGPDEVVLASHTDPVAVGAFARWGLDVATWGFFAGPTMPPEIVDQNPFADLYEDGFVIYELPSAAHHPTDYVVDAEGRVVTVEREYRGEYELAGD